MSFRIATSLAVLAATIGSPALAADWGEEFSAEEVYRGAYSVEPKDWTEMGDESDGVHIETGLRYWYSMGSQNFELGPDTSEESDTAHSVEAHLRIEDDATSTYGKAWAGYTAAISGSYSSTNPVPNSGDVIDGVLGYAGADFGWNAFSNNEGTGFGGFVGYNYWNNSPRTSRSGYATITGPDDIVYNDQSGTWSVPGDSVDDKLELHMLRLGLSGKAEINEFIDISAEVAAVPFTTISGIIGGHYLGDDIATYPGCPVPAPGDCGAPYFFKNSATEINGWGYGAMGEIMAGITPVQNLTIRLGGRAWYAQGSYDATFQGATVTPPQYQQVEDPDNPGTFIPADPPYAPPTVAVEDYIQTENPFSLLRYGLLAEITYSF